nr:RhuM family protein [Polaribacter sp. SA4-10]
MALTTWQGNAVRKQDIFIAKNYLNEDELDSLNRLVVIFLETAELRVKNRIDITMNFWKQNVDKVLEFNDKEVLKGLGSISSKQMEEKVRKIYAEFDTNRKFEETKKEDAIELEEIEKLLKKIK